MLGKALLFIFSSAAIANASTSGPPLRGNCLAAKHHQLDFWIGDWKVFQKIDDKQQIATSHIQGVMNGCGVRESYSSPTAPGGEYEGTSYSAYNRFDDKWHQFYIDVNGNATWYSGRVEGVDLVFTAPGNAGALLKMTYHPMANGAVEQIGANSSDGGKSWSVKYDYIYRK